MFIPHVDHKRLSPIVAQCHYRTALVAKCSGGDPLLQAPRPQIITKELDGPTFMKSNWELEYIEAIETASLSTA